MKYALLAYNTEPKTFEPIDAELAGLLAREPVTGWVRLCKAESATTLSLTEGTTVLTDGPFIDSKEYLGGLIIIEAANLDEALAYAAELQRTRTSGAIEVRPVLEDG